MATQSRATIVSGQARPASGLSLALDGRIIQLFGLQAPPSRARCATGHQSAPHDCGEAARAALAARLHANAAISCSMPENANRAAAPVAVCLDSTGVDLGGFLVGAGLALADPAQGRDYVGAEGVARSLRVGLWHYR